MTDPTQDRGKSFTELLRMYSGIVALGLSILIGGFTLYENLCGHERKEAAQTFRLLSLAGNDISQYAIILEEAMDVFSKRPDLLKFEHHIVLARRLYSALRHADAVNVLKAALPKAPNDIRRVQALLDMAENYADKGGSIFDPQTAREVYEKALGVMNRDNPQYSEKSEVFIRRSLVIFEIAHGTCEKAVAQWDTLLGIFERGSIDKQLRDSLVAEISRFAGDRAAACGISLN